MQKDDDSGVLGASPEISGTLTKWQKTQAQRLAFVKSQPTSKQCGKCGERKNEEGFVTYQKGISSRKYWADRCRACGGRAPTSAINISRGVPRTTSKGKPFTKSSKVKEGYTEGGTGLALEAFAYKTQQAFFMKGFGSALRALREGKVPFKEAACWAAVNGLRSEIEFLKTELLKNYVRKEAKNET